jgi:hypothetical protein
MNLWYKKKTLIDESTSVFRNNILKDYFNVCLLKIWYTSLMLLPFQIVC